MFPLTTPVLPGIVHTRIRWWIWLVTAVIAISLVGLLFLLETKKQFFSATDIPIHTATSTNKQPFPISVNPATKTITENPQVNNFLHTQIASNLTPSAKHQNWLALLTSKLVNLEWYQNLASPISRILLIQSGERAEQVSNNFARTLGWSNDEKQTFLATMEVVVPTLPDGKFYPGKYILEKGTTPTQAANTISNRFTTEIKDRYTGDIEAIVTLDQTLIIASLIEREANDFDDMRYISGVIWNRLFANMRLQIDATLQYVRGSQSNQPWWPVPVPKDKYLKSPYNTYLHAGLPPAPIASPSIDAIVAALNPHQTDCLFYFHDRKGVFHCTATYKEHVSLLKKYYGHGK